MNSELEKLYTLVKSLLDETCPRLSGSMSQHIEIAEVGDNEITIVISAPFYDVKEWKKTNKIVYTNATINGKTDYAEWVNMLGGFATGNSSMYWVDRACRDSSKTIAEEIGAEFIDDLKR